MRAMPFIVISWYEWKEAARFSHSCAGGQRYSGVMKGRAYRGLRLFLFARNRAPADIAAAEAARPADAIDRGISARLRLAHGSAARADIEHAAAGRDDVIAVALGAGVEDFHTLDLRRLIEAFDHGAFI